MEDQTRTNFRVLDLGNNIDLPIIRESGYRDWVTWGVDNRFPQFLVDTYHTRSITNKTIINRKVKMIAGEGWKKPIPASTVPMFENRFNEDNLDDVVYKAAFDLELFDGFALGIRWSQDGTKIAEIYHIPFESIRVDKNNNADGLPNYFWVNDDWSDRRMKPRKVQGFSEKYKENKNQLMYCTSYQPGHRLFYPIPNYYSSMNWIIAEWEISNYHRSTIQNGFNAGFLLNFATGIPTPEEMDRAYKEIEANYTGTFNAGKFILAFSNGVEQEARLTPIPLADTDSRYTALNDLIKQNIFTANEVTTPELFGVSVPGKMGSKNEMLESLEIFQAVYINAKQKFIENKFNRLTAINEVSPLELQKYLIDIKKISE